MANTLDSGLKPDSPVTSIGGFLTRAVAIWPDKVSHRYPVKGSTKAEYTYSQVLDKVHEYARAVDAMGITKGQHVVILGESSIEWIFMDWACFFLGLVVIPIYPTLPTDQALHIYQDSQAVHAFVLEERLSANLPGVPQTFLRGPSNLLNKAGTLTKEEMIRRMDQVQLDDLATIIYSSGTTGVPKGVMLRHRSFVDLCSNLPLTIPLDDHDVFLSFLPMSHVFERFAGVVFPVSLGASISLTSAALISTDLGGEKPTIMTVVPRLLDAMKTRIIDNAGKASPMQQKLFKLALEQGVRKNKGMAAPWFWLTDKLVGAKIRARVAPTIRFFVSGGAALPTHVSDFFLAFGICVLQGYGLTESCAASSLNHPGRNKPWTAGEPIKGVEMKIAPDGEILIRGTGNMIGYYNMPEATAEAIDPDGWFHTGDIGEFDGDSLKITDRKKDLLVLGNGKNVAPQKIENTLKESRWINEVVVFGDGMEYCCALIVPEFDAINDWLVKQGLPKVDPAELAEKPEVKALIKKAVDEANNKMADFERIKRHVLLGRAFSVETGELTPSFKVKRKTVKEMYAAQIQSMQRGG